MTPRARKTWIFGSTGFGLAMALITALGVSPLSEAESRALATPTVQPIPLPSLEAQIEALSAHGLELAREDEVRATDNIERLLSRMGVRDPEALRFLNKDRQAPAVLRANRGRIALVHTDLQGRLLRLQLLNGMDAWVVERAGENKFEIRTARLGTERQVEHRSVVVGSSFFGAMDQAGVPDGITDEIVSLFESDLDFRRQVNPGDKIRVIFETEKVAGRDIGDYRLIAVRFEASGETYEAMRFSTADNKRGNFYDAEGKSVKRGFLAAPLRYTRVSSNFSSYRLHPLFGDPRAHRGVDYAAPIGTPVRSVADGTIVEVGRNGGYGNAIEIRHNQRYSTYYAHLSAYAGRPRQGQQVRMGEVIGYVGATGWATGPHLHYEFRVQGRSVDPTKIAKENPQVPSLKGADLVAFQSVAEDLRKRLSLLDSVNTAAAPTP